MELHLENLVKDFSGTRAVDISCFFVESDTILSFFDIFIIFMTLCFFINLLILFFCYFSFIFFLIFFKKYL